MIYQFAIEALRVECRLNLNIRRSAHNLAYDPLRIVGYEDSSSIR